ncbi:prolipoprotein diacylglyceryl transferase [Desulfurispira natronophila]|uniref:Phosphatidylglycerol--prolipoprotein diacylglyceryl transferase n=1 Tax=Desulfurispira natronophila TaxID=682562 RepID=A0A7W7Y631_9BACT|nr:prolipoprotein diacylglyceryl transferase [Desulfurispira natronophila]MBB5022761.1 phosphatidylglycerol:prolipoprotein diacylglycerol transferase [Desulfurispira natronophila]
MQPVIFEIFGFALRYYSLMYILAAVAAYMVVSKIACERRMDMSREKKLDLIAFGLVGGIIGSRIYYVLFNWDRYSGDLLAMVAIWQGGLAIHGGVIGGAIAVYIYSSRQGFDRWSIADMGGLSVLLGQAFGRFGNFMNGDAHGIPTSMPWGVIFLPGTPAGNEFPGIPLHPVMLYELALNLTIFILLFTLRRKLVRGELIGWYLVSYGIIRSFTSLFRADDLYLLSVPVPYLASLIMIILGATIIWTRRKSAAHG